MHVSISTVSVGKTHSMFDQLLEMWSRAGPRVLCGDLPLGGCCPAGWRVPPALTACLPLSCPWGCLGVCWNEASVCVQYFLYPSVLWPFFFSFYFYFVLVLWPFERRWGWKLLLISVHRLHLISLKLELEWFSFSLCLVHLSIFPLWSVDYLLLAYHSSCLHFLWL